MDTTNYEFEIFDLISKCLDKDESIVFDKHFDFLLPNGVKKLGWKGDTVVSVKFRLEYDSYSRLYHLAIREHVKNLIVIAIVEDDMFFRFKRNIQLRNRQKITLKGYNEFVDEVKKTKFPIAVTENKKEECINEECINEECKNEESKNERFHKDKEEIIKEKLTRDIKNKKISIFIGAGVSASAGVVNWNSLLEELCIKKKIAKIDSEVDNVIKGRYIIDVYKQKEEKTNDSQDENKTDKFYESKIPDEFYEDIRKILYANAKKSNLIKAIAELINNCNIESIISYNYDDLVEQELGDKCQSIYDKSRLIEGKTRQIYHVHGCIPQKEEEDFSEIVLGEKEYHKVYQEAYNWGNVEQLHALCRSTCLFIGLSMKDPNLRRLIDISIDGSGVDPVHYAFLRRIEYNVPFMESIMRGFGVNCVWYDEHKDLPALLKELTPPQKKKSNPMAK